MFTNRTDDLNHLERAMLRLGMVLDSLNFLINAMEEDDTCTVYGVFEMLHDSIDKAYDDLDRYASEKGE